MKKNSQKHGYVSTLMHENNPKEPEKERAMDLANNRKSQIDYLKLGKDKINDQVILNKFKDNLKNKNLIIIKPNYAETGGLP